MSRYRKVVVNEVELPEINGTKFLIYPTVEMKMELLEHIKSAQVFEERDIKDEKGKVIDTVRTKGKFFNLPGIARTCAKMVFEACFTHDGQGKRITKKEDEKDTTEEQLLQIVLESDLMQLYLEIATALDIINKDKAKELKENQEAAEKKQ